MFSRATMRNGLSPCSSWHGAGLRFLQCRRCCSSQLRLGLFGRLWCVCTIVGSRPAVLDTRRRPSPPRLRYFVIASCVRRAQAPLLLTQQMACTPQKFHCVQTARGTRPLDLLRRLGPRAPYQLLQLRWINCCWQSAWSLFQYFQCDANPALKHIKCSLRFLLQ